MGGIAHRWYILDMTTGNPICGLCGRPLDDRHDAGGHDGADQAGQRVEYVVVGIRGGIAEFREADAESRVRRTDAATLALNLRVEQSSLLGRRYSCRVEPAEHGVIRSDFRLVAG